MCLCVCMSVCWLAATLLSILPPSMFAQFVRVTRFCVNSLKLFWLCLASWCFCCCRCSHHFKLVLSCTNSCSSHLPTHFILSTLILELIPHKNVGERGEEGVHDSPLLLFFVATSIFTRQLWRLYYLQIVLQFMVATQSLWPNTNRIRCYPFAKLLFVG